jgi:hypothetical protein
MQSAAYRLWRGVPSWPLEGRAGRHGQTALGRGWRSSGSTPVQRRERRSSKAARRLVRFRSSVTLSSGGVHSAIRADSPRHAGYRRHAFVRARGQRSITHRAIRLPVLNLCAKRLRLLVSVAVMRMSSVPGRFGAAWTASSGRGAAWRQRGCTVSRPSVRAGEVAVTGVWKLCSCVEASASKDVQKLPVRVGWV